MREPVRIYEMSPRDGIQNEEKLISTKDKISLIDQLSDCGFTHIEATSFVNPNWVPQMADARDVLRGIYRKKEMTYGALTPNLRGYQDAINSGVDEVAIFGSASEGFSQRNINCSINDSFLRFKSIFLASSIDNMKVRGYVSCIVDCPYDGPTPPNMVAEVAWQMLEMGCYEISLGDTIGTGAPDSISRMLDAVLTRIPATKLAGHYHDTNNQALDNIEVSLDRGLRVFDASVGGLGGCPYAPGAKGNVDTVAVAHLMADLGYETGLDISKLEKVAKFAQSLRKG
ncbi:MAG: hydroxymethylglutaryl-CoA lyase [Paracoccaceae bacterium]